MEGVDVLAVHVDVWLAPSHVPCIRLVQQIKEQTSCTDI